MLNVVVVFAKLVKDDLNNPIIRYIELTREYKGIKGQFEKDIIPIINWNRSNKGDIFSFPLDSILAIKGRLEVYQEKVVIVCESLSYLGKA